MRLEYTESQERELRITELNAVLENELYESNVEKYCLEIELQFLEGSKNVFGDPAAFIDADKISFEIIYEEESEDYSATVTLKCVAVLFLCASFCNNYFCSITL